MEETRTRSSQPAGSKARKTWESEEESLLLQLRQQNDRVSWARMQIIFNENVHPSRHRTSDALVCKYKIIKSRLLDRPSVSTPPSQPDLPPPSEGQSLKGLGIDVPTEENEVDWAAYWDSQLDMDGYLRYLVEAKANAIAMCARATAAAVGGSLTRCPNLETTDFKFPSELISAQRKRQRLASE